jgi:hypothetical protein
MARRGLCLGCALGLIAFAVVGVTLRWLEGTALWAGWGAFALFAWAAIMSIYSFDRPVPPGRTRRV